MSGDVLEDVRAAGAVERLLEDSWASRSRRAGRHEIAIEGAATALFLGIAVPLAAGHLAGRHVALGTVLLLMALYAIVSRTVKFPIGAGYVVPSYLVLVPMFVLLPSEVVPLVAPLGLMAGTLVRCVVRRSSPAQLLFAAPDAWHTLGPAAVLSVAATAQGVDRVAVYVVAFLAGCALDLLVSTLRESLILGVAPRLQGRVIGVVWLVDAAIAPLGLLVGDEARAHVLLLLLLLPLNFLLMLAERDRTARIEEAHRRLGVVARERTRLQAAVQRLADAFAAKLELGALADVVLHGSTDALDADGGRLILRGPGMGSLRTAVGPDALGALLESAIRAVSTR
jgi:GNAT superfamily N-acetyltransferase